MGDVLADQVRMPRNLWSPVVRFDEGLVAVDKILKGCLTCRIPRMPALPGASAADFGV